MFIVELFTIAKLWKQANLSSALKMGEWIKKMWGMYYVCKQWTTQ